ncbi:hypothetical protein KR009_006348 [Drosophila setifemur]|nr:hypothetical protein KR009_006348 [Drosophila setifemur]
MAWKTFTLMLLTIVTMASAVSLTTTTELPTSKPEPVTEEHFPAMAPPQAIESSGSSGQPILLQPPAAPPHGVPEEAGRRRTITYDQRQEGQYNIRADLENFMILLIPPGPQEGISLLDFLGRGATKSNSGSGGGKRKHPLRSNSLKSFYQKGQLQKLQQQQHLHQQSLPAAALPDFIEGRSPYHVDISASDPEHAQRLQRQQVDVLPPQLIPMPQLIKPFHLEAEPELIQALPPAPGGSSSSGSAGSNLLEGYNHPGSHYFRNSRSLRGDSYLDTNRLTGGDFAAHPRSISAPIFRSDLGGGAVGLYPPIDAPSYILDQARSWQLDEEPTRIQVAEPDIVSFDLLDDDDLADSRTLLRDGLARCARGERRDSYGACRQIEGY